MTGFQGFPEAALDVYDDLEMDSTKSFWEAHKAIYRESVKEPMTALTDRSRPGVRHSEGVPPLPRRPVDQGQVNSCLDR